MDLADTWVNNVMECPDRELAELLVTGNRDAFTAVYRTHSPGIFRFAYHMTGDRIKAGEITQEVFVWLIHNPGRYDPLRGALGAFLVGVARQCLRRQRRFEFRWAPFADSPRHANQYDTDPNRALDLEALRKAIAILPPCYREAVVLYDLEGNSYEETAAILRCSVGTVRSRLHRARGLLAKKFQQRMNS